MAKNLFTKNLLSILLLLTLVFPAFVSAQSATKAKSPARRSAEVITAKQLREFLYFVASDSMEGRDTPSRGLDLTAEFIGTMLSRWGFKPAGDDGTFYQKMAMTANNIDAEKTTVELGGKKLKYGNDFFANPATAAVANSPLVFAGNGWFIKQKNIDALAGLDVKGKTVVIYSETDYPDGLTQQDLFSGKYGRFGADILPPQFYAQTKGAAGLIIVASGDVDSRWGLFSSESGKGRATVDKLSTSGGGGGRRGRGIPTITISKETAEMLFQGEDKSASELLNAASFELKKTASYSVATKVVPAMTQNVVAIWEGSDPVLKNEMVAIGAHYDHVGTNPLTKGDDKIWNGADDDGSGTVSVLAIAEALANSKKRPKRSVLFVWHAGEEKGLLGSQFFNKFPTVDIKQVVAQLNIDMIGRSKKTGDTNEKNKELSGENEVYVIGADMMSSKLGEVTKSINNAYLKLNYDFRYDDPKDPNRFFFRSDHFNYAINGIPIVFWFDGVHEDYHQAGDEAQKIDYAKMEKIARTIYLTLWEIGDLKVRPPVDKELPKEMTSRPQN
jgi:Peptidase family M28